MTELIQRQLTVIFVMFYCGLAIMMLFELRNKFIKLAVRKKRIRRFIYLGSWLVAGYLFCQFLYHCSHGVYSIYGVVATLAGMLLWKKTIYGIIDGRKTNGKATEEEKI